MTTSIALRIILFFNFFFEENRSKRFESPFHFRLLSPKTRTRYDHFDSSQKNICLTRALFPKHELYFTLFFQKTQAFFSSFFLNLNILLFQRQTEQKVQAQKHLDSRFYI